MFVLAFSPMGGNFPFNSPSHSIHVQEKKPAFAEFRIRRLPNPATSTSTTIRNNKKNHHYFPFHSLFFLFFFFIHTFLLISDKEERD